MKVISKSKGGVTYPISLFGSKKLKGIPFWMESNYISNKDCIRLFQFKHPLQTIIYYLYKWFVKFDFEKDSVLNELLSRIKSLHGDKFFQLRGVLTYDGEIYAFSTLNDEMFYNEESRAEIMFSHMFDLGLDACPVVIGLREYKSQEELFKFSDEYFKNNKGSKLIFRDIDNNHILTIKK